jgi:hypothetical protein
MYKQRNRHGELGAIPFRSGRYYSIENEWWFAIRRGPDQGPYVTKSAARQGLIEYINEQFAFEKQLKNERAMLGSFMKQ